MTDALIAALELTGGEKFLLEWLGKEDFSQYGECKGRDLDRLVTLGCATIHAPGEHQRFISNGMGDDCRAVSLTESGIAALKAIAAQRGGG